MKILLVDDENLIRRALFMGLQLKGHKPVEVKYPLDALEKLRKEHFDLIVFDYKMSLLSGYDLIKILQSRENNTPALILTSMSAKEINTAGINLERNQILSKGNSIEDIINNIESYCSV
jgi:two-component system alkaline phosphatase synthesis response regulator PhoP